MICVGSGVYLLKSRPWYSQHILLLPQSYLANLCLMLLSETISIQEFYLTSAKLMLWAPPAAHAVSINPETWFPKLSGQQTLTLVI